jgi:hypothetical protein
MRLTKNIVSEPPHIQRERVWIVSPRSTSNARSKRSAGSSTVPAGASATVFVTIYPRIIGL